jgi:hypothetical protein
MIPAYSLAEIEKLKPCSGTWKKVKALKLGSGKLTAKDAVKAGVAFDDLVWVASAVAKSDPETESRLRAWLCDCAAHVLHIFEKERPTDFRVRDCIVTAQRFARGECSEADRAAAGAAARAAAWDAAWAAAWDAARDAAWDAARDAARAAARDAARAAAWAAARAAAWDAAWAADWDAAWAAERQWQLDRLVYWLSEDKPKFWPLPEPIKSQQAA